LKAILWLSLATVLFLGGVAGAKTGQSPDCRRFCVSVEPRTGPEGSVFRFTGRGWRPQRRVTVYYGPYCRPDQACPAIAYVGRLRTNRRGRFTLRLRAGAARAGDSDRKIASGANPTFEQRAGGRTVSRSPRYRVILPPECDCG
jgi:hypothetical protein